MHSCSETKYNKKYVHTKAHKCGVEISDSQIFKISIFGKKIIVCHFCRWDVSFRQFRYYTTIYIAMLGDFRTSCLMKSMYTQTAQFFFLKKKFSPRFSESAWV